MQRQGLTVRVCTVPYEDVPVVGCSRNARARPTVSRDILDLVLDLAEFTSIGDALVLCVKQLSVSNKKTTL